MSPARNSQIALRRTLWATALAGSLMLSGCNAAYHPYQVAGDSMLPLLKPGDRIFVDESSQARSDLRDGEIIVLRRDNIVVLKRILAMPGETIKGSDRKVFRNGKLLDEPYLVPATGESLAALTTFAEKTVPPGEFFVMGDNRDLSFDSRTPEYAPVRLSDIVGQYRFTYWHSLSAPQKNKKN
jgi:signal peptidase I